MLYLLNEGNKELENRRFVVPKGVRKHLVATLKQYKGDKTVDGYKRLNNLVSMTDGITYQEMKRLKNFFGHYNANTKSNEYILNGGDKMKFWVQRTLDVATKAVHDFKQAKKDGGIQNSFIKPHSKKRDIKGGNKPTKAKFDTKDMNKKMIDNDVLKYESIIRNKRIVITEGQRRFLMKEAQDDTFSFDVLESLTSFQKRLQYCKQHLGFQIGKGSSRIVFQLSDEKCLKLAINRKGVAQNEQECRTQYNSNLFPQVFDNDADYNYIVTEYVLPAKEEDFQHCLGISFYQFQKFIASSAYYRHGQLQHFMKFKMDEYVDLIENNEDLYEWDEYIGDDYSIGFGDMLRLVNYGMTRRNGYDTIVLLDHGLNDEIYNKFYR